MPNLCDFARVSWEVLTPRGRNSHGTNYMAALEYFNQVAKTEHALLVAIVSIQDEPETRTVVCQTFPSARFTANTQIIDFVPVIYGDSDPTDVIQNVGSSYAYAPWNDPQ